MYLYKFNFKTQIQFFFINNYYGVQNNLFVLPNTKKYYILDISNTLPELKKLILKIKALKYILK